MIARYGQLANLFLKISDLLLMLAALSLALVLNYAPEARVPISVYAVDFLSTRVKIANVLLCIAMALVWYLVFNLQGIYRSHRLSRFTEELKEIGRAVFLATLMLLTVAQIGHWQTITLWTAACVGLIGLGLIVVMRVLLRLNLRRLRLHGHNIKTLVIVGGGPRARWFANEVRQRSDLGYRVIGYVDDETNSTATASRVFPRLGDVGDLPRIIEHDVIDEVFVALPSSRSTRKSKLRSRCWRSRASWHLSTFRTGWPVRTLPNLKARPCCRFTVRRRSPGDEIKRMLDIAVALSALLLCSRCSRWWRSPSLDSTGPVFFIQTRGL